MASWIDSIYMKSPVWFQQIAVATWGAGWYRRRFGGKFKQYVREFHERDKWTADQFHEYQTTRLAHILDAAWNSPYYRKVFTEAGIRQNLDHWEALTRLPLLIKEALRTKGRDLLTCSKLPSGIKVFKSSGTTGTPSEIYFSHEFHVLQAAICEARNLNIAGVTYRDRRVMFGVRKVCRFNQKRPPFWRFSPVENMAYGSIYHLSPQFLPAYITFLRSFRPAVVMGYPSALSTIARYALQHNDLPAAARCIITTSETVTEQAREMMEAAFQCRVYDRYGAVEGCVFAGQCEYGSYHVSPDISILEILDRNGQPCSPGVMGEVVCTGLHNSLQPLIRYRIGDVACWAVDQHCRCGRQTPVIASIEGRVEDMCFTPDGRQMLRFDAVFKGVANIKEAQVVQKRLNLFVIYVVPSDGFGEHDIALLTTNMRHHVGEVETHIEQVDMIKRSPSGKFRAVVCDLPAEERCMATSLSGPK